MKEIEIVLGKGKLGVIMGHLRKLRKHLKMLVKSLHGASPFKQQLMLVMNPMDNRYFCEYFDILQDAKKLSNLQIKDRNTRI